MEGRGLSEFLRNSSEELFLKAVMENPVAMSAPTMEMLGFKNMSQNLRVDSEELFKRWLTNGENPGNNPPVTAQSSWLSRRRSGELANLSNQQNAATFSEEKSNDKLYTQNNPVVDDIHGNSNQNPVGNAVDRDQDTDLFLAKAWFLSNQPMTRSRSSELRRRYAAMQNAQTSPSIEFFHNVLQNGAYTFTPEFSDGINYLPTCEIPNQMGAFVSPSNSSSTFHNLQMGDVDKVSSCISMLRGTLERKRLGGQVELEPVLDNSNRLYCAQEVMLNTACFEELGNQIHEKPSTLEEVSTIPLEDPRALQTTEGSMDVEVEGFANTTNQVHLRIASGERSQSESSAAAPAASSGFDVCDGLSNSSQTHTISESSRKQVGASRSSVNGNRVKDFRECIMSNLKEDRKRGGLDRRGSVTSAVSVDKGDATKKRRVERSRKMAEAKERSLTPPIPSDMQAVLKRCENLEKEVRSLKLNLSFMNRKDSEQTKQIEELQKQNEELAEEKERLLEEIERIISGTMSHTC